MEDSKRSDSKMEKTEVELPSSVDIRVSNTGRELGAFCKHFIKKNTRFGPYKGEIIKAGQRADIDYRYAWEDVRRWDVSRRFLYHDNLFDIYQLVFEKRSNILRHTISAKDPANSNWMRHVNSARYFEEQNILSVQEGFSIFYVAMRDIKPDDELLTWFDPKLLKRTERRRTKTERKPIGYTIELVPWSEEKRFVPEIIETKRARKKKVMSDMLSFDEDAPLVQRSLNNAFKSSKKIDGVSSRNRSKSPRIPRPHSNGHSSSVSDNACPRTIGMSNLSDSMTSSKNLYKVSSFNMPTTSMFEGKASLQVPSLKPSLCLNSKGPQVNTELNVNSSKSMVPIYSVVSSTDRLTGRPRGRPRIHDVRTGTNGSRRVNRPRPRDLTKPFDPSVMKPVVIRRKEDGKLEVEDHDEIYITDKIFRKQCDRLCTCLDRSAVMSSHVKSTPLSNEDLYIHFSLVLDDKKSNCESIIYRCDICDSAYNHAFSLKRHYLNVHINHRYLSKKDIDDCQIETLHTGVETLHTRVETVEHIVGSSSTIPSDNTLEPGEIAFSSLSELEKNYVNEQLRKTHSKSLTKNLFPVETSNIEKSNVLTSTATKINESENQDVELQPEEARKGGEIGVSMEKDIAFAVESDGNKFKCMGGDIKENSYLNQSNSNGFSVKQDIVTQSHNNGKEEEKTSSVKHTEDVGGKEKDTLLQQSEMKANSIDTNVIVDSLQINQENMSDNKLDDEKLDVQTNETTQNRDNTNENINAIDFTETENNIECHSEKSDKCMDSNCLMKAKHDATDGSLHTFQQATNINSNTPSDPSKRTGAHHDTNKTTSFSQANADKPNTEESSKDSSLVAYTSTLPSVSSFSASKLSSSTSSSSCSSLMIPSTSVLPINSLVPTESKISTAQQQVILLVPVPSLLSPTAPHPPRISSNSKLPVAPAASGIPQNTLNQMNGLTMAPTGAISLISRPHGPMMVLSTGSSDSLLSIQHQPILIPSSGLNPVSKVPSLEKSIHALHPKYGNVKSTFIKHDKRLMLPTNSNIISTLNAGLKPQTGNSSYISTSFVTGSTENKHLGDLYRCHMCVLVFETTAELKHHILNDPHRFKGGVKQYACPQCSLRFRNKYNLNRHQMMNHNDKDVSDKKFRCLTCGKGFTTETYLKMHARFHLGKSFPCKYGCKDLVFPNAGSLVKHLRAVHPGLNLKEYVRDKMRKERMQRNSHTSANFAKEPLFNIFQPGQGLQAKRGRPKGSKKSQKLELPKQTLPSGSKTSDCLPSSTLSSIQENENITCVPLQTDLNKEISMKVNIPKKNFMYKCKLCPRSFPFHLRLLQHRSRRHGFSQSVQEFLYEMSKQSRDTCDSDSEEDLSFNISPPASPTTFFKNVNAKGAENMKSYIDGRQECLEQYKKESIADRKLISKILSPPKIIWPHFNFPLCFKYNDDTTVFYDCVDGVFPSFSSDSINTNDSNESIDCKRLLSKEYSSTGPSASIEKKEDKTDIKSELESSVEENTVCKTSSSYILDEHCVKKELLTSKSNVIPNLSDKNDSICSEIKNEPDSFGLSSGDSEKSNPKKEENCQLDASSLGLIKANNSSEETYKNPPETISGDNAKSFCSLVEDSSNEILFNKMLSQLKRHSFSCGSSVYERTKRKKECCLATSAKNALLPKHNSKGPQTLIVKALNLLTFPENLNYPSRRGITQTLCSNMQIKALDLQAPNIDEVAEKLRDCNYFSGWKRQRKSSLIISPCPGQSHRLHDHHHCIDSAFNISDSSKQDHRRYSIWSRQLSHSHKSDEKSELFNCSVVECVRKSQMMKEKAAWKGNVSTTNTSTDAKKCKKTFADKKKKDDFTTGLGLMTKQDYYQSYHTKQKEIPIIKPPEIWKTYEKIWFGKKGTIAIVCSICHRHFSCLDLCLRHQLKKHPHIEPNSLQIEKGNYVEDMYYYYPMAYGIVAHTQLIPNSLPSPELFVCTRCAFPFKTLNRLHFHIPMCDPSQGEPVARSQSCKKRRLLPMIDRRAQNSSSVHKGDSNSRRDTNSNTTFRTGYGNLNHSSLKMSKHKEPSSVEKKKNADNLIHKRTQKYDTASLYSRFPSSRANPNTIFFMSGLHKQNSLGPLYNPSNHIRRREQYQVLEQHQCHGCNLKFKSMSLLERHVKKCSGKDKLRSQKPLLSNLADEAAVRKQHTCRYCNKRFTFIKGVDLHYKRVCSVRKVKEEENQLTEEDLAHEAELQKIIEHMKWSKSLNKDSSDIILGLVRVEDDGTLIRVNKKRGRPYGASSRRMKKKGSKWTTLKRHRPDDDKASVDSNNGDEEIEDEEDRKCSQDMLASASSGNIVKQDFGKKNDESERRKRKISNEAEESSDQPQPPRKRGRPRKNVVLVRKGKRGRPRKSETDGPPKNVASQPDCKIPKEKPLTIAFETQKVSMNMSRKWGRNKKLSVQVNEGNGNEKVEESQSIGKPPTRKRGRPKKFDPSDMESSYKKKKKHELLAMKASLTTGQANVKSTPYLKQDHKEDQKTKERKISKRTQEKIDTSKHENKEIKRNQVKAVPYRKSISVFRTANLGKKTSSSDKNDNTQRITGSSPSKVIKISQSSANTDSIIEKTPDQSGNGPTVEQKKQAIDFNEMKNNTNQPLSEELLKYLTTDSPIKTLSTIGLKDISVPKNDSPNSVKKLDNSKSSPERSSDSINIMVPSDAASPQQKSIKTLPIASSSPIKKNMVKLSAIKSKDNANENLKSPQLKQKPLLQEAIEQVKTVVSSSSFVFVTGSEPGAVTATSQSSNTSVKPKQSLSLRVISLPAGGIAGSQLGSSPPTIKIIKSPLASPTSTGSKQPNADELNLVSQHSLALSASPSSSLSKTSTSTASNGKLVKVIPSCGVLRNAVPLNPSTSIPQVLSNNIRGIISAQNVRLPHSVLSGNVQLPQTIGPHLGSTVIVQPASLFQGKAKMPMMPTNIRMPPSRFACNTIPVRIPGIPTGARIVKVSNLNSGAINQATSGLISPPKQIPVMAIPIQSIIKQNKIPFEQTAPATLKTQGGGDEVGTQSQSPSVVKNISVSE